MPITPEQAQAELARRELARRELARRELAKRGSGKTDPVSLPAFMDSPGLAPVKRALDIQQEEAQSGREKISKAFTDPGVKNTLMGGLGALQYFFSPVTGAAQGIVGEPIEEGAKAIGVPDKGAEFIGKLGENATYFASPGAAIKTAMAAKGAPGLNAARKATQETVEFLNKAKPNFTIKKAEETVAKTESQVGGVPKTLRPSFSHLPQDEQAANNTFSLYRVDDVIPSADKPHGAFFSIEQPGFVSPHKDVGGKVFRKTASPKNPINVQPGNLADGTFADDSAIRALEAIKGAEFVNNLKSIGGIGRLSMELRGTSKGKTALMDYLKKEYPKVDWGKYHDSREMLMAVGGIEARKAGHDAIIMLDAANPSDSEFVALTNKIFDAGKTSKSAAGNPASSILMQPQLKEAVVKDVVDATRASIDVLQLDKSKRLFRNISDFLKAGEVQVQDLPGILKAENITPEEFAGIWTDTISRAGRELNHLSRLSKDIGFVFKDNPGAAEAFNRTHAQYKEGQYLWEKIGDGFARLEDFRRGLLVTQLATTMRNISSQAGRLVLAQFDDAIQTTIRQGMKAINLSDEATNGINIMNAAMSRLSSKGRMNLERIMDADKAATYKARVIGQTVHEVPAAGGAVDATVGRLAHMGQKFTYALNILNRGQEHFFRKIAFEAKLKQELANMGKDISKVNPAEIPEHLYEKATQYALEMTFSASPKSRTGREFINAWRKLGLTTVNPFPRFAFANAMPFMLDHSPLGYFKALSPEAIKGITSGNPEVFAKSISRATLGTLMLKSAWHFRQSEHAGEKWYQIKLSEDEKTHEAKYMDIRAFAPFSTYFFLAEAMLHPERMSGKDYFEAAIGLNRTAGTGLVVIDLLRSKKTETTAKLMENFVNAYASSFTVPFRTPKDIIAGFNPEEAKLRDTKNDPKWGPLAGAMGNIPFVSQQFPESPNPLSTKVKESETPILRQTTGVSVTTKNAVEREVERLGIGYETVYPKTGFPEADRDITRKMSPVIERVGPILFDHPFYKHRSDAWKKYLLEEVIKETKDYASKMYASENPEMALQLQYGRLDDDLKAIVEETIKNNPVLDRLKKK